DGGTIFLDEIGELPLDVQPKLLRVLEAGEITRVGDTQMRKVNVRLLAATHRNLRDEAKKGNFREDLYYRLAVVTLTTPALRNRRSDIPILVQHIASKEGSVNAEAIPAAALSFMLAYDWPGNVRELRNVVQ